eukprot:1657710-Alexandrium_andersonii.AAC.1
MTPRAGALCADAPLSEVPEGEEPSLPPGSPRRHPRRVRSAAQPSAQVHFVTYGLYIIGKPRS